MGEHTDKIRGRVKQAIGALTGNHDLKREGERQERKGEVKGHIDDAVDKAKHAADDVKDTIEEAVDKGSSLFRVGGSGEPPAAGAVEGRQQANSVCRVAPPAVGVKRHAHGPYSRGPAPICSGFGGA